MKPVRGVHVVSPEQWGPDLGLVDRGFFREIVGPSLGAECRSMYHVTLEPDSTTVSLSHPGEAVYYVTEGSASVVEHCGAQPTRHPLVAGSMFHVRADTVYAMESSSGARLVGGPSPVDARLGESEATSGAQGVTLFHRDQPGVLVPFISADARLVVWLGAGAVTANMNYVVLEPGERNKEHVHASSEDTIHILEGHGTAENVTTGERLEFGPGDTIHIEIGFWHAVAADRGERVVSVGGPCPADLDMLRFCGIDVDSLMGGSQS